MNTVTVFNVADWFLCKESMTPKKLQKLVYYAYAWGEALLQRELIPDCTFEAWVHGPVNKELYNKYRKYGWSDIPKKNDCFELDNLFSPKEIDLLESVWITYGNKSANELEVLTHMEKPWIEARVGYKENEICTEPISRDLMRSYYLSIYAGAQGE